MLKTTQRWMGWMKEGKLQVTLDQGNEASFKKRPVLPDTPLNVPWPDLGPSMDPGWRQKAMKKLRAKKEKPSRCFLRCWPHSGKGSGDRKAHTDAWSFPHKHRSSTFTAFIPLCFIQKPQVSWEKNEQQCSNTQWLRWSTFPSPRSPYTA